MHQQNLNGQWLCSVDHTNYFSMQIPGCWDTYTEQKDIATPVVFIKDFIVEQQHPFFMLHFGAVSYCCDIWLNDVYLGQHEGMWDSFWVDATSAVQVGENKLKLHITKPGYKPTDAFPLRQVLSGFIPDVLCTFGGIWDDVTLCAAPSYFVQNHFARGDMQGSGEVCVMVQTMQTQQLHTSFTLQDQNGDIVFASERHTSAMHAETLTISLPFAVEEPLLWNIDTPTLYTYQLQIQTDTQAETFGGKFGFRTITTQGSSILLNDITVYLRGALHWGCYDDAIIPNPSKDIIKDEILRCKQYGFNLLKHCLYIPRKAYFELADELGMLLWIELPLWLPEENPHLKERIRREYPAIVPQICGHPSTILFSLGCELNNAVSADILQEMYLYVKQESRALVRDNSGSGECYEGLSVDFADFFDYHFYGDLQNMENLMETFTPAWRNYRPWLYGEFCDSDTLRDLSSVRATKNVETLWWERADASRNPISELKPDFYAGEHDVRMEKSGIREDFEELQALSLRHSLVHRKTTLEQTRSFSAIGGYVLTTLRDVPIATSGLFDDCMQTKFDTTQFSRFNADVVLLPAWDLSRVWVNADRVLSRERYNYFAGDWYALHLLLSNYSPQKFTDFTLNWRLKTPQGDTILQGEEIAIQKEISCGSVQELHYLSFELPKCIAPTTYLLEVTVATNGQVFNNQWPVFVYPQLQETQTTFYCYDPTNQLAGIESIFEGVQLCTETNLTQLPLHSVLVTTQWNLAIQNWVEAGGRCFCMQHHKGALPTYSVAFWREGMIRTYPHPLLEGCLPQCEWDDLRYFGLSTDTALHPEEMAKQGFVLSNPILRRYDCRQWLCSEYLAEYQYGKGRLLATTLRLQGGMGKQTTYLENNPSAQVLLSKAIQHLT